MEALVASATRDANTSEDRWDVILRICEESNASVAQAREAVSALARRLPHRNANVGGSASLAFPSFPLDCTCAY